MELKKGDRVRAVFVYFIGEVFSVNENKATIRRDDGKIGSGDYIEGYGTGWEIMKRDGIWDTGGGGEGTLTLISSKSISNKTMNLKEKFVLLITPEPEKSRRKSGITDGDDFPTDEGVRAVISWWLKNSPDAIKFDEEIVKPMVKEIEKRQ